MTSKTHTVTPGTMAAQLVASGVVAAVKPTTTNYAYYDIIEDLNERLGDGRLKERVMSSMAWLLDGACITAARSVFYKAYDNAVNLNVLDVNTIESFNTMVVGMTALDHEATHVLEVGFEDESPMTQLKVMLLLRPDWHDAAGRAAQATGRDYQPRSFIELLAAEKLAKLDTVSHEKLRENAKFAADGDDALAEKLYAAAVKRQTDLAESRFKFRKGTDAAVARILSIAGDRAKLMMPVNSFTKAEGKATEFVHDLAVSFCTLPDKLQLRLIANAQAAIGRALDEMATDRRVTTHEHTLANADGRRCMKALTEVMKAPRFKRALDLD